MLPAQEFKIVSWRKSLDTAVDDETETASNFSVDQDASLSDSESIVSVATDSSTPQARVSNGWGRGRSCNQTTPL